MNHSEKIFLTAEWRWLAMLNYEINPAVLKPFIPAGTELDFWNGKTFVSMVGFMFLNTRIKGIPIPFHQNFEEVNLRFYVRRKVGNEWRRGVVFIKEIVPKPAIAFVARTFYNENYIHLPMSHRLDVSDESAKTICYGWSHKGRENFIQVEIKGPAQALQPNTLPEFIAEHYWGYAQQRDGSTMEYKVEHPRWNAWEATTAKLVCDAAHLYGDAFGNILNQTPASAFVADGSDVIVYGGVKV